MSHVPLGDLRPELLVRVSHGSVVARISPYLVQLRGVICLILRFKVFLKLLASRFEEVRLHFVAVHRVVSRDIVLSGRLTDLLDLTLIRFDARQGLTLVRD